MTTEDVCSFKISPQQVWKNIEDFALCLEAFGITFKDRSKKSKIRSHTKRLKKISKKLSSLLQLQIEAATGITGCTYEIDFYDSWSCPVSENDQFYLDVSLTITTSANHERSEIYTEGLDVDSDWGDREETEQEFLKICNFCKLMNSDHLRLSDFTFDLTLRSSGYVLS